VVTGNNEITPGVSTSTDTTAPPDQDPPTDSAPADPPEGAASSNPDQADSPATAPADLEQAEAPAEGAPEQVTVEPAALERWEKFAADPDVPVFEEVPRWRRVLRGVRRFAVHEWTVASGISLGLAVVMTWPTMRHPTRTIPQDIYDPLLQAWQVAWGGHALRTDPTNLWDSNAFFPEQDSFAYSDTLLGYAPLGMLGSGPEAAVLRYNILFVLLHALAFFGAYAFVRQLGARWPGAAVAGAAFAYAPWRLAHGGHMNILSTGGIALALAMLARGHGYSLRHGYRPERAKPAWALVGWLVAAWQLTLGFGLGLPFGYALLLTAVVAAIWWVAAWVRGRRRPYSPQLLLFNLGGGLLFAATTVAMALPYLRVRDAYPNAVRTELELTWYSPPLRGFITSPAESWLWGSAHEPARQALKFSAEMTVLPGLVLIGLALVGLFLSIWSVRQRILLAAGVAVTVALALGPNLYGGGAYGYLLLYRHLPGWDGIRTPGRLIVWTTLLLGILAAGAVCGFAERARRTAELTQVDERVAARPPLPLRIALLVPVLMVLVEGFNVTPHPDVPAEPAALRDVSGPVLVLPSGQLEDQITMLWSTDGFPRLVNGGSGFNPPKLDEIRKATANFPDPQSIEYLRRLGIKTVVVLPQLGPTQLANTPWAQAPRKPVDGLGVSRRDVDDAVVFTIQ